MNTNHNLVLQQNSVYDHVSVDYDKMIQVLTNLVSNAIKFSPEGGDVVVSIQQQKHSFMSIFLTKESAFQIKN